MEVIRISVTVVPLWGLVEGFGKSLVLGATCSLVSKWACCNQREKEKATSGAQADYHRKHLGLGGFPKSSVTLGLK